MESLSSGWPFTYFCTLASPSPLGIASVMGLYSHFLLLVCCLTLSLATSNVLVGLNDHLIWRGPADQDVAISWAQTSRAQILRSDVNWASLEPSKGSFSQNYLSNLDYALAKYSQLGVRVLLMLGTSPGWANGNSSSSWTPPLNPNDFANFCEFVVRRWGKYIDAIEVGWKDFFF